MHDRPGSPRSSALHVHALHVLPPEVCCCNASAVTGQVMGRSILGNAGHV